MKEIEKLFYPCTFMVGTDEEGGYYRVYIDAGEVRDYDALFESVGLEGSGHDWQDVIKLLLAECAPDLVQHIQFDSGADMFFTYPDSAESGEAFAQLIQNMAQDEALFKRLLASCG